MRIALPPVVDAAAFARRRADSVATDLDGETMGTRWSVRCVVPGECDVAGVRAAIVARLGGLVAEMSHWSQTSVLTRFNRSAAGAWTVLPPDFAHVVARALAIAETTRGAFDPAIGRIVDLWGFGPVAVAAPPDPDAVAAALAASGWTRLAFSAADRRLRQPGDLALDLSGIAKGYAADAVAEVLAGMGILDCLVEIGGELVGRGVRPDGEPWWVDLESPPGLACAPLRIALHGLAVATSGNYVRGAHTLDPRTGHAAATGVVSASVIAATALDADAWATALTVLGAAEGVAIAMQWGLAARLVTTIDGEVCEHLTPALQAMLSDR